MDHKPWSGRGERCPWCERPLPTEFSDPDDGVCGGLAGCLDLEQREELVIRLRGQLQMERQIRMALGGNPTSIERAERERAAKLLRDLSTQVMLDGVPAIRLSKFLLQIAQRLETPMIVPRREEAVSREAVG